jgi:GDP-L-fucose synthase
MSNNILITGGSGLIGYALKDIVSQKYKNINDYNFIFLSSKDGDLRKIEECNKLFDLYKPSKIIHLAARVGGLYENERNNYEMFFDNIKINMNIIECCKKYKIKDGIMCLSTCVYPKYVKYPIVEDYIHDGKPHESNYGYSYSKRSLEILVELYNEEIGANLKCITPTNIYGPNDNFHLEKSHVLPALIHKCYLSKLFDTPLIIKGSGKARRQFVYSYDVADLILRLLFVNNNKYNNYIISPNINSEISIKELVEIIRNSFDINEKNIKYDNSFSDGQIIKTVDNKRITELFPNFQFIDLKMGILDTISWFVRNYDTCRK